MFALTEKCPGCGFSLSADNFPRGTISVTFFTLPSFAAIFSPFSCLWHSTASLFPSKHVFFIFAPFDWPLTHFACSLHHLWWYRALLCLQSSKIKEEKQQHWLMRVWQLLLTGLNTVSAGMPTTELWFCHFEIRCGRGWRASRSVYRKRRILPAGCFHFCSLCWVRYYTL